MQRIIEGNVGTGQKYLRPGRQGNTNEGYSQV